MPTRADPGAHAQSLNRDAPDDETVRTGQSVGEEDLGWQYVSAGHTSANSQLVEFGTDVSAERHSDRLLVWQ